MLNLAPFNEIDDVANISALVKLFVSVFICKAVSVHRAPPD